MALSSLVALEVRNFSKILHGTLPTARPVSRVNGAVEPLAKACRRRVHDLEHAVFVSGLAAQGLPLGRSEIGRVFDAVGQTRNTIKPYAVGSVAKICDG